MSEEQNREFEEGGAGTKADRKKDPTKEYDEKEPMSPAKIKEHEPTAVKRDASDQRIVEPGQQGGGTNSEVARLNVLHMQLRLVVNMSNVSHEKTNN